MSAEKRWHQDTLQKETDPSVPEAILTWMNGLRGQKGAALFPDLGSSRANELPELGPDRAPKDSETAAVLLQAIQGTEIAARLNGKSQPDHGRRPAPAPAEPQKIDRGGDILKPPAGISATMSMLLRAMKDTEVAAFLEEVTPPGNGQSETALAEAANAVDSVSAPEEPAASPASASAVCPVAANEPAEAGPAAPGAEQPDAKPLPEFLRSMQDTEIAAFLEAFVAPAKGAHGKAGPDKQAEAAGAASEAAAEPASPAAKPLTELLRSMQDTETAAFLEAFVVPAKEANKGSAQTRPAKTASHPKARPPATSLPAAPVRPDPAPAPPARLPAAVERAAAGTRPETGGPIKPLRPQVRRAASSVRARAAKAIGKHISKDRILGHVNQKLSGLAFKVGLTPERLDWAEMQLETRFEKWFEPPDPRRRSRRLPKPPVLAFYWPSQDPRACEVVDISLGGLHLITEDRWPEGSIVSLALQRTDRAKGTPDSWVAVDFRVVRLCDGSLAGAFIPAPPDVRYTAAGRAENSADKKTLHRFVRQLVPPDQM